MYQAIEGVYRNGKIEFSEPPPQADETRVLVTFLTKYGTVDLSAYGVTPAQAAELRTRLGAIIEDWDSPEMDIYDEI